MKWHLIFTFFLLSFFSAVFPLEVAAQKFSASVSPSSYEIVSRSGQTINLPYSFTNAGDPTVVTLKVYSTFSKDSQGTLELLPLAQSTQASRISFSLNDEATALDTPFLLQSGKTIVSQLKMTLPEDLPEGDYLISLVLESEKQPGFENGSRIYLTGSLASTILLTVTNSGALERNVKTTVFRVKSPYSFSFFGRTITFVDSLNPIPIVLTAVNTGKNAAHIKGSISLKPFFLKTPDESAILKVLDAYDAQKKEQTDLSLIEKQILYASTQKTVQAGDRFCTSNEDHSVCEGDQSTIFSGKLLGIYRLSLTIFTDMIPETILKNDQHLIIFPFSLSMELGGVLLVLIAFMVFKRKKLKA